MGFFFQILDEGDERKSEATSSCCSPSTEMFIHAVAILMNVTVHVAVKIAVGLLGNVWVTITVTVSNSTYMYL